jgi:uncharacterized membrane protein
MTMPSTAGLTNSPEAVDHREPLLVGALVASFVLSAWGNSLFHYFAFKTGTGDFSVFEQSIYSTLHGRFMYNTFEGGNHLAVHFSPILLMFVPVGMVCPSAVTLAWISALGLGVAAWLLYQEARRAGVGAAGALVTLMLLLHGTFQYNARNFYELGLLPLPMVLLFRAYRQRKLGAFLASCIVVAAIRESLFVLIASWGIIAWVQSRSKRWIWLPLCIAAVHFFLARHATQCAPGQCAASLLDYYRGYGASVSDILDQLRSDPLLPAHFLFRSEKLGYAARILLPFLVVLPFLRWWWLPALPTAMFILFSSNGRIVRPEMHYSMDVVMWLALSAFVYLLSQETRLAQPRSRVLLHRVIAICAVLFAVHGAVTGVRAARSLGTPRYRNFATIRAAVPSQATVLAPRYLANHLANRPELYFWDDDIRAESWDLAQYAVREQSPREPLPMGWRLVRQAGSFQLFHNDN